MKTRSILASALTAGFLAVSAMAQGPGGPPGGFSPLAISASGTAGTPDLTAITAYLTLTTSEITSLQAIVTQTQTSIQGIQQQMQTNMQSLNTLLQGTSPDPTALGNLLLTNQSLQAQMTKILTAAQTQAAAVLTTAQQTLLTNLQNAQTLMPDVREAIMLNLLVPPTNIGGLAGFGGPGGPGGPPSQ